MLTPEAVTSPTSAAAVIPVAELWPSDAALPAAPRPSPDSRNPAPVTPEWPIQVIASAKDLGTLVKTLQKEKMISVDTETWGPDGERLDRDLCLIQIGVPPKGKQPHGTSYLVDVIALTNEAAAGENPLAAMKGLLEDRGILKVAHHAQFETAQFAKYKISLQGVEDTEKLARELRPDMASYTLRACCIEILGVSLSKEEQKSDWHKRPLSESQRDYAALDAEWTVKLHQKLDAMRKSIAVDPAWDNDKLLAEIVAATGKRLDMVRDAGIGNDYALEQVRIERLTAQLQENLKKQLKPGEQVADHYGPNGSARVGRRAVTELDIDRLRAEFPDIAEVVIQATVKLKDLTDELKRRNFDTEQIEDVLSRLKKVVGYSTPAAQVWPKYSNLYQQKGEE